MSVFLFFIFLFFNLFVTPLFAQNIPLHLIKLPEGFKIELFAFNVPYSRSLALGDKGTIFVGTRSTGAVYALVDEDKDFKADKVYTIAKDLTSPNGVVFKDGNLYVAEINRILRFDHIEDFLENPPQPVVLTDTLPKDTSHGWKYLQFGPDNKLYFGIGAPCNVCLREDERYASITRINPDGSALEVFAKGIRNTLGFDWHPETKDLWFTDNGRDELGDNIPSDELNKAPTQGMHFGFPFCHGQKILDPEFGLNKKCADYTLPQVELGPHVAALGMKFYTGAMFPEEYKNQIFIAEHGSWNRSQKIGYRLTAVNFPLDEASQYKVFAYGWLQEDKPWGRPVDILILPDGSLLISDDFAHAIYRISYSEGQAPSK